MKTSVGTLPYFGSIENECVAFSLNINLTATCVLVSRHIELTTNPNPPHPSSVLGCSYFARKSEFSLWFDSSFSLVD